MKNWAMTQAFIGLIWIVNTGLYTAVHSSTVVYVKTRMTKYCIV